MSIKYLTVLGFSEATLSMIFDNLESINLYPFIEVINNLKLEPKYKFENIKFNYDILEKPSGHKSSYILGAFGVKAKRSLHSLYNKDDYCNVFHASCNISSQAIFGKGCIVNGNSTITAHSLIGNFVSINRHVSIGHHVTINDFVTINPASNIAGHVSVGEGTTIGMGSNITDNIKIGKNSIIGAGSLVLSDIPDNVIAFGNPCKVVRDNQ